MKATLPTTLLILALPLLLIAQGPREERGGAASAKAESKKATEQRLKELLFPSIDFKEMKLSECINWLKTHRVPIEMGPDVQDEHAPVNLILRDVTAAEAVQQLAKVTNTRLVIANGLVTIRSATLLPIKEWKVSAGYFGDEVNAGESTVSAKAFLAKRGVEFPQHAFALYNGAKNLLVVKQTEEGLEKVDALLRKSEGSNP